ncbi:MAG: hypothetical protein WDN72_04340 [Alphaproteobacteria bacterium]
MTYKDIVLACLTRASQDGAILRAAQRQARERDIPWATVYLELWDDHREARQNSRNRALEQIALAERMGAITFTIKAADYPRAIAEALSECERRELIPRLVLAGNVTGTNSANLRRVTAALVEGFRGTELQFVAPSDKLTRSSWLERFSTRPLTLSSVCWAVGRHRLRLRAHPVYPHVPAGGRARLYRTRSSST